MTIIVRAALKRYRKNSCVRHELAWPRPSASTGPKDLQNLAARESPERGSRSPCPAPKQQRVLPRRNNPQLQTTHKLMDACIATTAVNAHLMYVERSRIETGASLENNSDVEPPDVSSDSARTPQAGPHRGPASKTKAPANTARRPTMSLFYRFTA